MPLPENCIDLIGPSRVKRTYDPVLIKILQSDKIPSLIQPFSKPTRIISLYNPEKEEKSVRQVIEMLEKEINIQYSNFDRTKYEEIFSEITFGRGIINLLLRKFFCFTSNYNPQAEKIRKILWTIANIESYGFVTPYQRMKESDTLQRQNLLHLIVDNCKDLLPPEFSNLNESELTKKIDKYLNRPEEMLNGYSHFGKLQKIQDPQPKELVQYYNFQAIETVICNSSDIVLIASGLTGADFKSLFHKLRFSRANYEIYSRPWESNHILFVFNRGYRLFNANDTTSKYLSKIILKHLIPSLISRKNPFILMNLMKFRGKDLIIHLLPEDFSNAKAYDTPNSLLPSKTEMEAFDLLDSDEEDDDEFEFESFERSNPEITLDDDNDPEYKKTETDFDSQIESEFAKAFQISMGSEWTLEREPEIITTKSGKVMIPDFTMSNGSITIYLEIVGFWTVKYIKNKLLKITELNQEDIPPFFFLIDEDLKKYFKELTLRNKNLHLLYYKENKLDKSIANLKEVVTKHYSTISAVKEKIESLLLSESIWNDIEKTLEKQPIIAEDQLFNMLKVLLCDFLTPKCTISPEQIPNTEIERILNTIKFKQQILEQRSFTIFKSIGAITIANFRQLEKIIVEVIGNDEISEQELHGRFAKVVPQSPIEPMKVVQNSSRFKVRWAGLVSKLISVKKI